MTVVPAATAIDLAFLKTRRGELDAQMEVAKLRLKSLEAQISLAKSHMVGINGAMQENEHMIDLVSPAAPAETPPAGGSPDAAPNASVAAAPAAVEESAAPAEVPKDPAA